MSEVPPYIPFLLTHGLLGLLPTRLSMLCRSPVIMAAREFFVENLLVRVNLTIVMIMWTGLAPWIMARIRQSRPYSGIGSQV